MTQHRVHSILALSIALTFAQGAQAQSQTANPATLQSQEQRTERYYQQREAQVPAAVVDPVQAPDAPQATPAGASDVRFTLREVRFGESAFLDAAAMQAVAQPYVGREIGIADLNAMTDGVNALYAARGITTARAVLGRQAINDGVVLVELVEGRLGAMTVHGNAQTNTDFVRSRVRQREGDVVDSNALRRDLVWFNRTTDLQARALLRPGAERGSTDVLLELTEPPRRYVDVFVDNAGVDSTGRERIGVQAMLNGLAGASDRLSASLAYAEGGLEGQAAYSRIVTRRNARLGVSASRSQINIINGAFRDLDIEGESTVYGLDFVQPLKATPQWLANGLATLSRGDSETSVGGRRIADTTSTVFSVGASLAHDVPGRQWVLTQIVSSIDADEPVSGKDRFNIAVGNALVLQRFGESAWGLRGSAGWQFSTDDALPASNLFQIGGLGSVRGYERGVLSGPRGYFVDLELHRSIGTQWDTYAFVDHGVVRGDGVTSDGITGVGLGAAWRRNWLSASFDIGHPLDDVIADQDSTRIDFRITARWQ